MKQKKVFAVANRKGGVGKTTTAVNLAAGLAQKLIGNGHVLIVDLDPQANVSASLGMDIGDGPTIADLLLGEAQIHETTYQTGLDGSSRENLWAIPAGDDLQDAKEEMIIAFGIETALRRQSGRARRNRLSRDPKELLNQFLGPALREFDFIILDCPPSLDILRDAVYNFADAAIVPVKPDYLGSAGTVRHTENIIEAQAEGFDIRVELFVPTFFRKREILANQMLTDLRSVYGSSMVAEPIPQSVVLERAPAAGKTIFEYAPDTPAAEAYADLADRIWGDFAPEMEVFDGQEAI